MSYSLAVESVCDFYDLSPSEAKVYESLFTLARHCRDVFPSREWITKKVNISIRTVSRINSKLKSLGLADVKQRYNTSNKFTVPLASLSDEEIISKYKKEALTTQYVNKNEADVSSDGTKWPTNNKHKYINNIIHTSSSSSQNSCEEFEHTTSDLFVDSHHDIWSEYEQYTTEVFHYRQSSNKSSLPSHEKEQGDQFLITKQHKKLAEEANLDVEEVAKKYTDHNRGKKIFNHIAAFTGFIKKTISLGYNKNNTGATNGFRKSGSAVIEQSARAYAANPPDFYPERESTIDFLRQAGSYCMD